MVRACNLSVPAALLLLVIAKHTAAHGLAHDARWRALKQRRASRAFCTWRILRARFSDGAACYCSIPGLNMYSPYLFKKEGGGKKKTAAKLHCKHIITSPNKTTRRTGWCSFPPALLALYTCAGRRTGRRTRTFVAEALCPHRAWRAARCGVWANWDPTAHLLTHRGGANAHALRGYRALHDRRARQQSRASVPKQPGCLRAPETTHTTSGATSRAQLSSGGSWNACAAWRLISRLYSTALRLVAWIKHT